MICAYKEKCSIRLEDDTCYMTIGKCPSQRDPEKQAYLVRKDSEMEALKACWNRGSKQNFAVECAIHMQRQNATIYYNLGDNV